AKKLSGKTITSATNEPKNAICKVSITAPKAVSMRAQFGGNQSWRISEKYCVESSNLAQLKSVTRPLQITKPSNSKAMVIFFRLNHIAVHPFIQSFPFRS